MRGLPPIVVNSPPTKTLPRETTIDRTRPFAFGFHEVSNPVVLSMVARRPHGCPPIVVNNPPTYRRRPSSENVNTVSFGHVETGRETGRTIEYGQIVARLKRMVSCPTSPT